MIRKLWEQGRGLLDRAVSYALRPYVGRLMEEMSAKLEFEGECEDEDIPDCLNCEHSGHCPWEPGLSYEPPPGFVLVRRGPMTPRNRMN